MAKQGRRPTELENPKIQNLITALRAGNYFEHACAYAGIASSTAYRWLERGRREQQSQADGNKPNSIEQHYLELCETIEKARADAIVGNVAIIQNAAKAGTWQAAAWWLERTMPNQFGRQLKAEVTTGMSHRERNALKRKAEKQRTTLEELAKKSSRHT